MSVSWAEGESVRVRVRPCRVDRVEIRCPDCWIARSVTKDAARRRPDHLCQPCGQARALGKASPVATDYRRWWLAQYSLDEIHALAAGLVAPNTPVEAEPAEDVLTDVLLDRLQRTGA